MSSSFRNEWREAVRDSDLGSSAKLLALVLSTYMDTNGKCWPSKLTLSQNCSLVLRAVDGALHRLEEAGFVEIDRSKGRRPNTYQGTLPNPARRTGVKPLSNP